jgi:uncharacterized repeat protein (TIGR03803 family)
VKSVDCNACSTMDRTETPHRKIRHIIAGLCALAMALALPATGQNAENLRLDQSPASYNVLYSFVGYPNDGAQPYDIGGALVRDAAGNLYGTTQAGGAANCNGQEYQPGTVFEFSNGGVESMLFNFSDSNCGGTVGVVPSGALTTDSTGNFYGVTQNGGPNGCGLVFKLSGSTFTPLHYFNNSSDGCNAYAGVILDRQGNLYGTTVNGASGFGTVYEISSQGVFSVLYTFTGGSDGGNPYGGLAIDLVGSLYGMTLDGGSAACSCGVVYQLSHSGGGWTENVLHSFAGAPHDGANPRFASLTLKSSGPLLTIYGVTEFGGTLSTGTAFSLVRGRSGFNYSVLYNFTGMNGDGAQPRGTLLLLNNKLYGTTAAGGNAGGWGTVFQLSPGSSPLGGWRETILYNFSGGADGGTPIAGLVADPTGAAMPAEEVPEGNGLGPGRLPVRTADVKRSPDQGRYLLSDQRKSFG